LGNPPLVPLPVSPHARSVVSAPSVGDPLPKRLLERFGGRQNHYKKQKIRSNGADKKRKKWGKKGVAKPQRYLF